MCFTILRWSSRVKSMIILTLKPVRVPKPSWNTSRCFCKISWTGLTAVLCKTKYFLPIYFEYLKPIASHQCKTWTLNYKQWYFIALCLVCNIGIHRPQYRYGFTRIWSKTYLWRWKVSLGLQFSKCTFRHQRLLCLIALTLWFPLCQLIHSRVWLLQRLWYSLAGTLLWHHPVCYLWLSVICLVGLLSTNFL